MKKYKFIGTEQDLIDNGFVDNLIDGCLVKREVFMMGDTEVSFQGIAIENLTNEVFIVGTHRSMVFDNLGHELKGTNKEKRKKLKYLIDKGLVVEVENENDSKRNV